MWRSLLNRFGFADVFLAVPGHLQSDTASVIFRHGGALQQKTRDEAG
jgi:hypothetical protein